MKIGKKIAKAERTEAENGASVSASAFFHIPTPEFGELHEKDGDLPGGGRAIDFAEDKPGFETRIVIPAKNRSSNTRSNVDERSRLTLRLSIDAIPQSKRVDAKR